MTKTLSPARGWLFQEDLRQLRESYEASRSTPDNRMRRAEEQWAQLEKDVAEGKATFSEENENGQVIYDHGDHYGELASEIGNVQQLVREAFVISLYHFWERQARRILGKEYKPKTALAELQALGLAPDASELNRLRLTCNVAKHSAGDSADALYQLFPAMFDQKRMQEFGTGPDYESLLLTDADVEAFFAIVKQSGPLQPRSFWAKQTATT